MFKRNSYKKTWSELASEKSMIFLAGPRQSGKTTLAKIISEEYASKLYFNWDIVSHREKLLKNSTFFEEVERKGDGNPLIILDEIHKYPAWKNYLKGVYDQFNDTYKFLVSGSGRLDIYQKGGDSLAGRYFMFHLWPFTMSELGEQPLPFESFIAAPLQINTARDRELQNIWGNLATLSGFPEPYSSGKVTTWRRWSTGYAQQLIKEDIRDIIDIKSSSVMETLYHLLASRIGSPLSIPSLSRDLQISYNTVQNWLTIFERFFMLISISPWTERVARAIQKERKIYLFDTPRILDKGARFENMVALDLWRAITSWNDLGLGNFSLHFIKNKEQQEVDFLIAMDNEPFLLVEAKATDKQPSAVLRKFQQILNVPAVQLTNEGEGYRLFANGEQKIVVAPAWLWLAGLP